MRTIEDIRHARLLELLERYPTIQALADKIERSHAQVSQWKNRSKRSSGGVATIESATARHIEKMIGEPEGWMDNDPDLLQASPAPLDAELMRRLAAQPPATRQAVESILLSVLNLVTAQPPKVVQLAHQRHRA